MRPLPFLLCGLVLFGATSGLACAQRVHGERPTASGGALLPEQAGYDVRFYDLRLEVHPAARRIEGVLTAHVRVERPLEWLVLDLDTLLSVQGVTVDGTGGAFERRGGRIWIRLAGGRRPGDLVAASVRYGGRPRVAPSPPWVGGFTWAETADGQPWIGVSCQSDGADLWWPVKDHPSDEPDSMALHVTVPEPLVAASNGRSRGVSREADGRRTFHWFVSTPINNYAVSLNIAPYRTIEGRYRSVTGEEVPVTFWVLPEHLEQGRRLFPQLAEHLRFYEETLGPYPFRADKYGVAETPYLGMEHQTIIAYGADFEDNEFGFDGLHHHELGHEWWGNLVTASDWRDFWLHEGFCSYMQPLYAERLHGEEAYHRAMASSRDRMLHAKPLAPREPRTTTEMYFVPPDFTRSDPDIYNKGEWVLHSLRFLLGDEAFFRALRRMAYPDPALERVTDGGQTRLVTTDDFVRIAEAAAGQELDWFFEVYVRQPALPRLVTATRENRLMLEWATPGGLPFPMPVEVEIDGAVRRVPMPGGRAVVELRPGERAVVDPKGWVLKAE